MFSCAFCEISISIFFTQHFWKISSRIGHDILINVLKECIVFLIWTAWGLFNFYFKQRLSIWSFTKNTSFISFHREISFTYSKIKAICKPRHWNLGIGNGIRIGIRTDTINAIISSNIRPMDTKPSRVAI